MDGDVLRTNGKVCFTFEGYQENRNEGKCFTFNKIRPQLYVNKYTSLHKYLLNSQKQITDLFFKLKLKTTILKNFRVNIIQTKNIRIKTIEGVLGNSYLN